MARAAARESVKIAGRPERVAVARAFAAAVLGGQHPADETSVLLRWDSSGMAITSQPGSSFGTADH